MRPLPTISVIVPSFNHGKYLGETLESIFRQDYPHLEVVVVDGGSTDDSLKVIEGYAHRLAYWHSRPDNGQAHAISLGAARCNGELLTWLNSDDLYWKDCLWTVARAFLHHPGCGLYIGNGLRYREGIYHPFCARHVALNREALVEGLDYVLQPATFFLRAAWEAVGGLNERLHYCLDWDIIIRIAQRYPAALVNEFLAASREYPETKTGSGGMPRAMEILNLARAYGAAEVTPGALFYFCEALLTPNNGSTIAEFKPHFYQLMQAVADRFRRSWGNEDGFPELSDPQDVTYLPFAEATNPRDPKTNDGQNLPSISIVTPSYNQAQFLGQALDSLRNQAYPGLEMIVIDGSSSDDSANVIRERQEDLAYWVSEPDRGPAQAINKGFARATGEVLAWLNSDDLLAEGTLLEVGKAFANDPELDMVYANALYIDESNQLFLADHGHCKTGLYYGWMQTREMVPAYWKYIHAVPQPTVFFRRRLLDQCGVLDEAFHFIFDFELFWRFQGKAKIQKIEKTLAFYRIHSKAKTAGWKNFEIELYHFSRPKWARVGSAEFMTTLRDFTYHFMRRKYPWLSRGFRYYCIAGCVALSVTSLLGNPERLPIFPPRSKRANRPAVPPNASGKVEIFPNSPLTTRLQEGSQKETQARLPVRTTTPRYHSFFCSYGLPRYPGHSGGEIRDFHILRYLLGISAMEFYALYCADDDPRGTCLEPLIDRLFTADSAVADHRGLVDRAASWLRTRNVPVPAMHYHFDAHERLPRIRSQVSGVLQKALVERNPDFLFVSPQSNPVAMCIDPRHIRTRFIMASYDVERVRLERLAQSNTGLAGVALRAEARRAARFERDTLRLYDGIIAVSPLDRDIFVRDYAFPEDRVLVLDNGVDPEYFQFRERVLAPRPEIVYTGSFTYPPNRQAAWRLIRQIMPAVWERHPGARLWVVGQSAGSELEAAADGDRIVVTGRVKDVRPYLAGATIGCVPLVSGSGTKYKVLEALSAGVPLVCSPIAAEGLDLHDGEHLLVRHTDLEIAAALVKLLDEPAMAQQLARRGRALVEGRYAWDAFLPRLDDWLDYLEHAPLLRATASVASARDT